MNIEEQNRIRGLNTVKDVLTSEWKPAKLCINSMGLFLFPQEGSEKLSIPSKLVKVRTERERSPENLGH